MGLYLLARTARCGYGMAGWVGGWVGHREVFLIHLPGGAEHGPNGFPFFHAVDEAHVEPLLFV